MKNGLLKLAIDFEINKENLIIAYSAGEITTREFFDRWKILHQDVRDRLNSKIEIARELTSELNRADEQETPFRKAS